MPSLVRCPVRLHSNLWVVCSIFVHSNRSHSFFFLFFFLKMEDWSFETFYVSYVINLLHFWNWFSSCTIETSMFYHNYFHCWSILHPSSWRINYWIIIFTLYCSWLQIMIYYSTKTLIHHYFFFKILVHLTKHMDCNLKSCLIILIVLVIQFKFGFMTWWMV